MNYGQAVQWAPGITLEAMEKSCIEAAFRFYRGNKTQTAGALGISIRTLDNKLEKYDADRQTELDRTEQRKIADAKTLSRHRGPELTRQFSTGSSSQWAADELDIAERAKRVNEGREEILSKADAENVSEGDATSAGVSVEPTFETRTEHPVPVSQRKEVQGVLSRQASSGSSRRNR